MKKSLKITIWVLAGVLLLALTLLLGLSALEAYNITHPETGTVYTYPSELELVFDMERQGNLQYWYIPAQMRGHDPTPSKKTVILVSNYGDGQDLQSINGLYYARYLVENGYNVVTFRTTEGSYVFGGTEDVFAIIDIVKSTYAPEFLALQGWGFGATKALLAAEAVDCVIADSAYEQLDTALQNMLPLRTAFPFPALVRMWMKTPDSAATTATLASQSGKSFFLIHGTDDTVFARDDVWAFQSALAANNTVEIWEPQAPHAAAFAVKEEDYANRAILFLNEVSQ